MNILTRIFKDENENWILLISPLKVDKREIELCNM